MKQFVQASNIITFVFTGILVLVSHIYSEQKPQIFLCNDEAAIKKNKGNGKLVYSYINGKKTDCMSEQKLMATLIMSANPIDTSQKSYAGAQLQEADLGGANLKGANLTDANLKSADLRNVDFSGAILKGADLSGAYLKKANLTNADLTGVTMTGTYFHEADLTNAKGLNIENLSLTKSLYKSKIDSTLLFAIEECCPDKLKDPKWMWNSNEWSRGVNFNKKQRLPKNEELR